MNRCRVCRPIDGGDLPPPEATSAEPPAALAQPFVRRACALHQGQDPAGAPEAVALEWPALEERVADRLKPTGRFYNTGDMPRIGLEQKDRRRKAFLQAASRCASRMGFKDMTLDDVCQEAKMSKGAFYTYFAQKDELLLAMFEDDARSLDDMMADLERRIPNNRERIRLYTRAVLSRSENPAVVQVGADIWTAIATDKAVRGGVGRMMQARRVRLRSWIEGAIETGELVELPANALASILLALSDGLLLHGSVDPTAFRWANIGKVLDVFLERMTP